VLLDLTGNGCNWVGRDPSQAFSVRSLYGPPYTAEVAEDGRVDNGRKRPNRDFPSRSTGGNLLISFGLSAALTQHQTQFFFSCFV